jgi:hypothetical protein
MLANKIDTSKTNKATPTPLVRCFEMALPNVYT